MQSYVAIQKNPFNDSAYLVLPMTFLYKASVIAVQVIRLVRLIIWPIKYLQTPPLEQYQRFTNFLRVGDVNSHIKGGSKDQIYLVPPTTVPVKT